MATAEELPGLSWKTVGSAYMWAVEQASRPDYVSPAAVVYHHMMGGIGGRSSEFGPRDFRDLAHTILTRVGNMPDRQALAAFRHVYGLLQEERRESVASTVARHVLPHHPVRYSLCKAAALVAVDRARLAVQHPRMLKGRGMGDYARAFLLKSKGSLYDGPWLALIADTEQDFAGALERGKRRAAETLEPVGIVA